MPAKSNRLLLDEYPLILLPTLASVFGDRDAIFLQQLHYWLKIYEKQHNLRHYHAGRWWIYNSAKAWLEQFPFWKAPTIRRIITRNRSKLVLITSNYNRAPYDRTLWFTLNYEQIDSQIEQWKTSPERHRPRPFDQNDQMDQLKLIESIQPDQSNGSGQNDHMHLIKTIEPIPETTQRLPETNTDLDSLWRQCTIELRMQMTQATYSQWIAPLRLIALNPNEHSATIQCDSVFTLDWCRNKLNVTITRTLSGVLETAIIITYKLKEVQLVPPVHTTT